MPRKNPITTRSSRSNTRKSPFTNSKPHNKEEEKRKTRLSLHKSPLVEVAPVINHPKSTPSPSLFTRSKLQKGQSSKVVSPPLSSERLTRSKEKIQQKPSDAETPKTKQTTPSSLRSKRSLRDDIDDDEDKKPQSMKESRVTRSGKRTRSSQELYSPVGDSDTPSKRRRTRSSQGTPLLAESSKGSGKKAKQSESPKKKPSPSKSSKRKTRHSIGSKSKLVENDDDKDTEEVSEGEEEEEEENEDDYNGNVNKSYKKGKSQTSVGSASKKKTKKIVTNKKVSKSVKNVKTPPVKAKQTSRRRSSSVSAKKDSSMDTNLTPPASRARSRSRGRQEKPVNDLKMSPRPSKGRRSTQRSEPAHIESSGQRRSTPSRNRRSSQKSQKSKKMPPDQPSRQSKEEEERMEEGSSAEQEASEDGTKSIDMEAEGETKTASEKEQHVDEDETMNEPTTETEPETEENSNKRKRSEDDSISENPDPEIKKPKIEPEEEKKEKTEDKQEVKSETVKEESSEPPVESIVDAVIENEKKSDSRASVITSSESTGEIRKEEAAATQEDSKAEETLESPAPAPEAKDLVKEDVKSEESIDAEKETPADNVKIDPDTNKEENEKIIKVQEDAGESSEPINKTAAEKESSEMTEEQKTIGEKVKENEVVKLDKEKIEDVKPEESINEPDSIISKDENKGNETSASSDNLEKESKEAVKEDVESSKKAEEIGVEKEKVSSETTSSMKQCSEDVEADKTENAASAQDQGSSEMDTELRLSESNSNASHSELETSLEKSDDSLPVLPKEDAVASESAATETSQEPQQPGAEEKPIDSSKTLTSDSKKESLEEEEAMDVEETQEEKPSAATSENNEMEVDVDDSLLHETDKAPSESASEMVSTNKEEKEAESSCSKETDIQSEQPPHPENNGRISGETESPEESAASSKKQEDAPLTASIIPPDKELDLTSCEKDAEDVNSSASNSIQQNNDDHKIGDEARSEQAPDARDSSTDAKIEESAKNDRLEEKVDTAGASSCKEEGQTKDAVASSVINENDSIEHNGASSSESCDKKDNEDVSQNTSASEAPEESKVTDHVSSPKSNGVMVESVELDVMSATAGETLNRKFVYNSLLDSQTMEKANEKKFAVVSYNLQGLEGIITNHENLLNELKQLEPCILCVQDVDAPYFEKTLQPSLKSLGYSGIYRKNKVAERGLATMYLTSVFEALDHKALDVYDLVQKDIENSGLEASEKEALSSYLDHSLFVLYTKLRSLSSQKCICVCNASFPAEDLSLHALQIAVTVRELTSQSEGSGNPHILCGTFNMEESCPGYQILKDGYLSNEMIEDLQGRKNVPIPNKENAALVNLLWKCFQHPSSNLKSSYNTVVGDDPKTSSNFHSSKDSVWFSSDSLHLLGVLDISDSTSSETKKNIHLSLKAHFSFVN